MCGRFVQLPIQTPSRAPWAHLADELMRIPARYNLAPTQSATVILDEAEPTAASFRWGLLPHWAKDLGVGARGINARIETVAEKPMFRAAFKAARRCLIPMAGYYEWRAFPDGKQPFFIHRKDGEMLYAAGLWESRHRLQPEEEPGTFVIITSDSIDAVQNLHERMPVYLGPDQLEEWAAAPPDRAMDMLLAAAVQPLTAYPVSRQVNNARNRGGPEFLEPVEVATPTN